MGRTPLLLPLVGLVCGILIATFLPELPLWLFIAVGLIGVSGAFWRSGTAFFLLVFLALGWGDVIIQRPRQLPVSGLNLYAAKVLSTQQTSGNAMMGIATIDSVNNSRIAPFNVSVQIIGHRNEICPGQRIAFHSNLECLKEQEPIPDVTFMNPNDVRLNVIGFVRVLPDSLYFRGYASGFVPAMQRLNVRLQHRLSESELDDNAYGLLAAMLLGDKSSLLPEDVDTFSAAGISHLLALSGTHVAVIVTLISLVLFPFTVARRNQPRYILSILFLWLYAALTGMSPSVTRAVIMASVYLFGRILQRTSVPLNSLCLAAIIILFVSPTELFSAGFQMSFAAVGGIIIFYPLINRVNRRKHPLLYMLWSYPVLSISAMLLTSLVSAWYFHTFPLYFLFANLFVVPLMPLILFGGVLLIAFPSFDSLAMAVNKLCELMQDFSLALSRLPNAVIGDIYLPLWLTLALLALLLLFGMSIHYRRYALTLASLMLAVTAVSADCLMPRQYPEFESFELDNALVVRRECSLTVYVNYRNESERELLQRHFNKRLRHYAGRRRLSMPEIRNMSEKV